MTVLGRPVPYGIAAHARSVVVYALLEGAKRFRAFAAIDDGALTQPTGASVRFSVHVLPLPEDADPAGVPVRVPLSQLGLSGPCRVRDLWEGRDLGAVGGEMVAVGVSRQQRAAIVATPAYWESHPHYHVSVCVYFTSSALPCDRGGTGTRE